MVMSVCKTGTDRVLFSQSCTVVLSFKCHVLFSEPVDVIHEGGAVQAAFL